jgi:hypothetical protein
LGENAGGLSLIKPDIEFATQGSQAHVGCIMNEKRARGHSVPVTASGFRY